MRYHNITKEDMLNGEGLRSVLWLAGCTHHCKNCQNPITWDINGGIPFDEDAKQELFESLDKDYVSGITFSGGDPLHPQNRKEVFALAKEKGFICNGVTDVPVDYAGDVGTMIDIFRKLLDHLEDEDILYACFTYGVKPMPIAELMAIMYAYRVKRNVSIECIVYGEKDHSADPPVQKIFDITALAHLDELVRLLAENRVERPLGVIDAIIELSKGDDNE